MCYCINLQRFWFYNDWWTGQLYILEIKIELTRSTVAHHLHVLSNHSFVPWTEIKWNALHFKEQSTSGLEIHIWCYVIQTLILYFISWLSPNLVMSTNLLKEKQPTPSFILPVCSQCWEKVCANIVDVGVVLAGRVRFVIVLVPRRDVLVIPVNPGTV